MLGLIALAGFFTLDDSSSQPPAPRSSPNWTNFPTGVTARLRGISAVSDRVVWASGSNGTIVRTDDGGTSWKLLSVPDAQKLDFRDVDAVDDRTAYALSIGNGDASRIYKTTDAGATWTLQFRNAEPDAFYDAMTFSNARTGYALSDSVRGELILIRTTDGGESWTRVTGLPPALPNEGAYAASGTNVGLLGSHIWLATTASRVIRSTDGGRSWSAVTTPLPTGPSAGLFSIAFKDWNRGIVVGGDYKAEAAARDNAALSRDGGATWMLVRGLGGFRSAVAFIAAREDTVVAVGPSGADCSRDGGTTWQPIDGPGFHTLSVAPRSTSAWAAGENGSIARLDF